MFTCEQPTNVYCATPKDWLSDREGRVSISGMRVKQAMIGSPDQRAGQHRPTRSNLSSSDDPDTACQALARRAQPVVSITPLTRRELADYANLRVRAAAFAIARPC